MNFFEGFQRQKNLPSNVMHWRILFYQIKPLKEFETRLNRGTKKNASIERPCSCQKVFEESGFGRKFLDFSSALSHKQFGTS